jgi:predicted TIM-barrel enzyme
VSHEAIPGLRRVLIGMVHLLPLPGSPRATLLVFGAGVSVK